MEPPSPISPSSAASASRSSNESQRNAWANTQPRIRPLSDQFQSPAREHFHGSPKEREKEKGTELHPGPPENGEHGHGIRNANGSGRSAIEALEEIVEEEEEGNTPRGVESSRHSPSRSSEGRGPDGEEASSEGEEGEEMEDAMSVLGIGGEDSFARTPPSFSMSTPHLTLDSSIPFENVSLDSSANSPNAHPNLLSNKHRPRALNLHFSNGSTGSMAFKHEEGREKKMEGFGPKRPSSVMGIVRPGAKREKVSKSEKKEGIKEEGVSEGKEGERANGKEGAKEEEDDTSSRGVNASTTTTISVAPRQSLSEPSSSSKRISTGPTPLQKVLSKTRPRNLPPKDPLEDKRHLKMHEEMMRASKELEKEKEGLKKFRRMSREMRLDAARGSWEREVLPNWKIVLRDEPHSKYLRDLWWKGTMPPRHRGRLWSLCIGNALAIGKTSYTRSLSHALNLIDTSQFDPDVLTAIEEDISACFVGLKIFQKETGPMYTDLREVLLAWSVFWKERPNYVKGAAYPAALLLLNLSPPEAFLSLVNLISKSCLKCLYSNDEETIEAYYRIFDTILADNLPKLYQHFLATSIRPSLYLRPWLLSAFSAYLPFDTTVRLFDVFLLEGDSLLFRLALALLEILESRLLVLKGVEEVEEVLDGRERGVVSVLRREKESLLSTSSSGAGAGGGGGGGGEETEVGREEVYEAMGAGEERLWRVVEGREWRKETWERLVERELPE
ncbi:RabGAP/TBC [Atractiella rhizophila]|nr:RabGAP/TBC [Atractiella rhizophila]